MGHIYKVTNKESFYEAVEPEQEEQASDDTESA